MQVPKVGLQVALQLSSLQPLSYLFYRLSLSFFSASLEQKMASK